VPDAGAAAPNTRLPMARCVLFVTVTSVAMSAANVAVKPVPVPTIPPAQLVPVVQEPLLVEIHVPFAADAIRGNAAIVPASITPSSRDGMAVLRDARVFNVRMVCHLVGEGLRKKKETMRSRTNRGESAIEWLCHARPRGADAQISDCNLALARELEREPFKTMVAVHALAHDRPFSWFRRAGEPVR